MKIICVRVREYCYYCQLDIMRPGFVLEIILVAHAIDEILIKLRNVDRDLVFRDEIVENEGVFHEIQRFYEVLLEHGFVESEELKNIVTFFIRLFLFFETLLLTSVYREI